ncbi:hypothetical protein [Porphyromonas gingivicanis]|uniref:hypothetical protein n=1 Tax=Porphyromonas gingivicanis TaxID=266762 RepID=UPI000B23508C|nr:hypothetical protein [Porphyromonas gingivicanis]
MRHYCIGVGSAKASARDASAHFRTLGTTSTATAYPTTIRQNPLLVIKNDHKGTTYRLALHHALSRPS